MLKLLVYLNPLLHIDPLIYELQEKVKFLKFILWGLAIVILLLAIIIFLQRRSISIYKKGKPLSAKPKLFGKKKKTPLKSDKSAKAAPRDLPDPGLIFKYSLAKENVTDKHITIGQTEGSIKTFSTEIIDDHLSVYIRIIENQRDRDIYDLPDLIIEEYQLDLRRDGKALIYYPGLKGFQEMSSRERIYVKPNPDAGGDPTFKSLEAKTPVRIRLGDRLNQDGKFINGYFEFHLFTQDYEVKTSAGIPKTEKNFFLRLYKIYPGYDTGSPTDDGLYPMIDPFTTG